MDGLIIQVWGASGACVVLSGGVCRGLSVVPVFCLVCACLCRCCLGLPVRACLCLSCVCVCVRRCLGAVCGVRGPPCVPLVLPVSCLASCLRAPFPSRPVPRLCCAALFLVVCVRRLVWPPVCLRRCCSSRPLCAPRLPCCLPLSCLCGVLSRRVWRRVPASVPVCLWMRCSVPWRVPVCCLLAPSLVRACACVSCAFACLWRCV